MQLRSQNGWRTCVLSDVTERVTVGIASAATHAYRPTGVTLIRNMNIKRGYIDKTDLLFIDPHFEKKHCSKRLRPGDVITVRSGDPGASAVVPAEFIGAQCFTSLITTPRSQELDLKQAFRMRRIPDQASKVANLRMN